MGGKQHHQDPCAEERQAAEVQVSAIDIATTGTSIASRVLGIQYRGLGKTNFEGHDLNEMIDMVESANPEHLESAAEALAKAKTAIHDAAEELDGHIRKVDWEGESGNAFREWGGNLVLHARKLAEFAGNAGTQMMAASTGLASVRRAMPPRDTRPVRKTVADIPTPEQVQSNKEYAAAVKAEKDRQEAINQMNRLASFYAVSEEHLAAQEPPTFQVMPDVGVPKPQWSWKERPVPQADEGTVTHKPVAFDHDTKPVVLDHDTSSVVSGHTRSSDTTTPLDRVDGSRVVPDTHVGTKIDSMSTLPPQETARPLPTPEPSVTGTSGASGGMVPPIASGTVPPAFGGPAGRVTGLGGVSGTKPPISGNRPPISAQGRVGGAGGTATGRSATGPVGRAATTGQSAIHGGKGTASRSPMGRGITGRTPRPVGGTAPGRTGGTPSTGVPRGNGVVGGRPTTNAESTGSRLPRGTVVGAEGGTPARTPAGKIGQRGVIGTPDSKTGARSGQAARSIPGNPDGVVGKPMGRTPAGGNGGPVGNSPKATQVSTGNKRNANRSDDKDERRPYTQQRNTPPVTDEH
jgi:uncharacterized protein YukE